MSDETFSGADFETALGGETSTPDTSGSVATTDDSAPQGAATIPPAETTVATGSTDPANTGPIPFTVHKTALDNARSKAVEEYRQQYGWAEQVHRDDLQSAIGLAQRYQGDPIGFLRELVVEVSNHPEHGARLRQLNEQALGQHQQQQQAQQSGFPQADVQIMDANGVAGETYSAPLMQQIVQQAVQQAVAQVQQEFAPVTETYRTMQQREAVAVAQAQAQEFAGSTMQDASTWPGMDDKANRLAVAERIKAMQLTSDDPRDLQLALSRAWRDTVLPKMQAAERQAVVRDIHSRASAATVNPGAPSTATPTALKDMSWADALRHGVANMAR